MRISCAGFPAKLPFEDFVDHFWNLVPDLLAKPDLDDAALARGIAARAGLQGHQIGRTKVRIRPRLLSLKNVLSMGSTPVPAQSQF